jgi:uncharacterized lipoprotein YddW (UPF0748 family)
MIGPLIPCTLMRRFSTLWKHFFHPVENGRNRFPSVGKLLLALLISLPAPALAARRIDSFSKGSAATWKPYMKSPPAVSTDDGVAFPLPFARLKKRDRFAWDKTVSYDLSQAVAFELDLSCPQPGSVRKMGLYFKSGNGWYVGNRPLGNPGRQTLRFLKSNFTTEGKPAGWNRIDGIRLSPWKGTDPHNTVLTVQRLATVEGSLVLVRGTTSCPDAGARAVADKTTDRISQMLISAGIGHRIITDDDLTKGALFNTTAALLPYNPNPTAGQLKALTGFLKRGGKLGVFYGSSPVLAKAMGFKLGKYVKAARPDRWRSIVFDQPQAWLVPPQIWQKSPNLLPALPSAPGSQIIAAWQNARGVRQPEPAIVLSPKGFWMSHVLMSDDVQAKTEMLVSLCATLDPSLWAPAALRAIQDAGHINAYSSLAQAIAELHRQLPAAARPLETRALIDEAAALSASIHTAWTAEDPRKALFYARRQRQLLLRADASVQVPRPGEFVGVWDHDGTGYIPGDWNYTANLLATNGVNAIFPNLVWGGCAHYPSKYLPPSNTLRLYGDQLAASLAAAQAHRQQLHVWMVLWKLDGAPPAFVERMKKEGRLQMTANGKTRPWLSPHHPANRALVLNVVAEITKNYPGIAGIHLDYIRLPDSLSCFNPVTRKRFESALGKNIRIWPADVQKGGAYAAAFRRWRTDDITALVGNIRVRLRKTDPKVKLSAAVFGTAAPGGGNIAQYWPDWLRKGFVDTLMPMDYTESSSEFASWVRKQASYPGAKGRIIPGIGVTADESRLDPAQTIRQVALTRQAGCPGFMLFSLTGTLRDETLPALRQGITRPIH